MSERLSSPVIKRNRAMHFLCKLMDNYAISHLEVDGLENLSEVRQILSDGGNVLVWPNHMVQADGPMIHKSMRENGYRDLSGNLLFILGSMLTKKWYEWYLAQGFDSILMPADRDRDIPDEMKSLMVKSGLKEAESAVNSGKLLTVFAEGGRTPAQQMRRVKHNLAVYTRLGSPDNTYHLPVGLVGDEIWPYNNKLPRFQKEGAVTYGQPFSIESLGINITGNKEQDDQNIMDVMMSRVAELLPEKYRGYYSLTSAENS